MECRVRALPGAVVWTPPRLIKASVGPRKASHVGHLPTAFQRFCRPQAHQSRNLPSLLIIPDPNVPVDGKIWASRQPNRYAQARIGPFFIDTGFFVYYHRDMLTGIRIFSSDVVWRHVLAELGATLTENSLLCDVNLDNLQLEPSIPVAALKSIIISEMDSDKIISDVFNKPVSLSPAQTQIVTLLYKSGGMSANDLKVALGYSPDATTHSVETAIYGLRKLYGRDFIKNTDGIFKLGRI